MGHPALLLAGERFVARILLSPLGGFVPQCPFRPRLAPWAAFFRRFAAVGHELRAIASLQFPSHGKRLFLKRLDELETAASWALVT